MRWHFAPSTFTPETTTVWSFPDRGDWATHPPYASIIPYSHDREGDLSSVHNITEFAAEMGKVAVECMRVLKTGKHCAVLIGDTRQNKHFVPITPRVLMSFLEVGFILREDIIKL